MIRALVASAIRLGGAAALAQEFPDKPIRSVYEAGRDTLDQRARSV